MEPRVWTKKLKIATRKLFDSLRMFLLNVDIAMVLIWNFKLWHHCFTIKLFLNLMVELIFFIKFCLDVVMIKKLFRCRRQKHWWAMMFSSYVLIEPTWIMNVIELNKSAIVARYKLLQQNLKFKMNALREAQQTLHWIKRIQITKRTWLRIIHDNFKFCRWHNKWNGVTFSKWIGKIGLNCDRFNKN